MSADLTAGHAAKDRADRIRAGLARIEATYQDISEAVATAYHERDWGTLGYGSWDAYVEGEFAGHLPKLSRDERCQFVGELREAGLSTRAIGSVAGVSQDTVNRDLASGERYRSPAQSDQELPKVAGDEGAQPANVSAPGPVAPAPPPAPVITGADGRRYPASRPAPATVLPLPVPSADGEIEPGIVTGPVISGQELADAQRDAELDAEMEETAARFRRNFSAALARADDVWQFDIGRIAELYSAGNTDGLIPWLDEMNRWCKRVTDAIRREQSGLRVVRGGAR